MAEGGNPRAARKRVGRFEQFSGWLTLAANLGVLGGLVLVLLQLNQNEHMMRAQTRHEIAAGIVTLLADTGGNAQLSDVTYRGARGLTLTPVERQQYNLRMGALLRLWEDEHYQYRMGLYDEAEFDKERQNWRGVLATNKGLPRLWCRNRGNFSVAFAKELNALIDPRVCKV